MRYISTRNKSAESVYFSETLLHGAPKDGGLYVPESWYQPPPISAGQPSYIEWAAEVILPYVEPEVSELELKKLIKKSYKSFSTKEIIPLRHLKELDIYLLELFHGPTLAFKDVALQLVGNLLEHVLKVRSSHATILTATSGDTGAAAIYACLGKENLEVIVFHPKGLVSDIQRKMMTSVDAPNVKNVAIEGDFDDCQKLVKKLFHDPALDSLNLTAMNSINWMRIITQTVYYFYAQSRVQSSAEAVFCVPSGNFGNIYAGWVAKQMGAPIKQLIAGVNKNVTLQQFIKSGELQHLNTQASLAPSMDVSVPSNLERTIFELLDRSGEKTNSYYSAFQNGESQRVELDSEFKDFWDAYSISDDQIRNIIQKVKLECGAWVDPHTAIGIGAMLEAREKNTALSAHPQIVLATAHPAKFSELYSTEKNPPHLPKEFKDLESRKEHYETLPANYDLIKEYIVRK